jgi:uncharacterized protein
MGCGDTSAQHDGHGEVCAAGGGAVEAAAARVGDRKRHSLGAWVLLFGVRFYVMFLSPILGGACRFHPSCSNYAYEAVARHGAIRGTALTVKRLLRCQPFSKGGFDPVPEVIYKEDRMQEPKSAEICDAEMAVRTSAHRPTQPVVAETWSAAGALGVERRL